jgi:hypothetical protein
MAIYCIQTTQLQPQVATLRSQQRKVAISGNCVLYQKQQQSVCVITCTGT